MCAVHVFSVLLSITQFICYKMKIAFICEMGAML